MSWIDLLSQQGKGTPKHSLSIKAAYMLPKDGKHFKAQTVGYTKRKYSESNKHEIEQIGLFLGKGIVEPVYTLVTDWEFEQAPEGYQGNDILALSIEYYTKLKGIVEEAQTIMFEEK